jgi:hypothetical protein
VSRPYQLETVPAGDRAAGDRPAGRSSAHPRILGPAT